MTYIGQQPATTFDSGIQDRFTGLSTNTVTLTHEISAEEDILVVWNNIVQDKNTYSVGGTGNKTVTLGGTLASGDVVTVYYLNKVMQSVNPTAGSVGLEQLSATGTASSSNFLRGDNAWATPSDNGKIGQVLQTTKTDTSSITSSSYTEFDSNFRCAITPSATSSKILVTLHMVVGGDGNTMHTALYENTTAIFLGDASATRPRDTITITPSGQYQTMSISWSYLHSPNSTSEQSYRVYGRSNGSASYYINRTHGDRDSANYDGRSASSLTVMEVLA